MGEMITKPDANPIIFALANFFFCGALGYFLMGQKKKAMVGAAVWFGLVLLGMCTFGIGTIAIPLFSLATTYDAYLLGQKLQSGESIGLNENGLEALNALFKD